MRTGENIYKRKDGRWEARYPKGRHDNGKIKYGFCYGRTYSEAKSKLEQAKKATTEISVVQIVGATKFGRICSEWLQSNRLRLKPSSLAKYQTAIEKHSNPSLGELCLCRISTAAISEFGLRLRSERGLAPKTVQDILILVHGILEYGAKQYAKEKHGLRYTRYTGLAQVTNWVKLAFAAMNLKKLAKWRWKDNHSNCISYIISIIFPQYVMNPCLA